MHDLLEHHDETVALEGLTLAVRRWGNSGSRRVLALHGWLDNAASFAEIAPHLPGAIIVAPDLAGHGWSEHRRGDSGYYLWDYALDMHCLVRNLGWNRYSVLAHSMGTGVAAILASISEGVESLVFLDGLGAPFTVEAQDVVRHFRRSFRTLDMARKARLHGFSDPATAQFANRGDAVTERRKAVGGLLTAKAAEILAERDLRKAGTGYRWGHDPRLTLPEPIQLTDQQAGTFVSSIRFPLTVVLGRNGLFVRPSLAGKIDLLPKHTAIHWQDGGHHFHVVNPTAELISIINAGLGAASKSAVDATYGVQ